MLKSILLSGLLLLSSIFVTGCSTIVPSVQAPSIQDPRVLERQQLCLVVEEYAHLTSQRLNRTNKLSRASSLKTKYKVEACKKIMFTDEGYGIVSFRFYDVDEVLPKREDEVMVALLYHEGKWTIANAQLLYSTPQPVKEQKKDDGVLHVDSDEKKIKAGDDGK